MSGPKFVTSVDSSPVRLLLTGKNTSLSEEILQQLRAYPKLLVSVSSRPEEENPAPQVIIHFVGFASPSLNETLEFTTHLHQLLEFSRQKHVQFVFVVPAAQSSLKHAAETLLLQYTQKFPLNYFVVGVDPSDPVPESAAKIISRVVHGHRPPAATISPFPSLRPTPIPSRSRRLSLWLLLPLVLIAPYLLIVIQTLILIGFSSCALDSYLSSRYSAAAACVKIALPLADLLSPQVRYLPGAAPLYTSLGYPPAVSLSALTAFSRHLESFTRFADTLRVFSTGNFSNSQTPGLLSSTSESLAYFQAVLRDFYLSSSRPPPFLLPLGQRLASFHSFFSKLSGLTASGQDFFPPRPVNYLILLQDNSELRPTGGFLDSFFVVTVDSGRIAQVHPFTTAQSDSQLKGQISPPPSLQTALGETQWFLRDANWDPDFSATANRAAWFVNKELSLPVDVVVAINAGIFPQLLDILGPQAIPQSQSRLTSANFYPQYFASLPTGSNQNSSFLLSLSQNLVASHPALTSPQASALLALLSRQLESRQIFISPVSFSSPALDASGWSGGVSLSSCSRSPCLRDYFYPVASNIGVNKADYFVTRQTRLNLRFSPAAITSAAQIVYTNNSPASGPGGAYKNFLRVYLPPGSQIDSVSVNSRVLLPPDRTLSYDHGLLLVSFLTVTPPARTTTVDLIYHQPLSAVSRFHYQLDLPPQPGISAFPAQIFVNYPPNWQVTAYTDAANPVAPIASAGLLRYNTEGPQISKLDLDILPAD